MAALYFISHGFYMAPNMSDEGNVWEDGPTPAGVIVYSVFTPILCAFAILFNALSLMVLMRKELKGSIYIYLSVLAFCDLCTSILTFFGGLSRGILYVDYWPIIDAFLGVPIAQIFNCLTVLTTIAVMIDRIVYLSNPTVCNRPKYCTTRMAKMYMLIALILSILASMPYFFVFEWEKGRLVTNDFYYSKYYNFHNWFVFIVFGIFSSILLFTGNIYLVYLLRKCKRIKAKCYPSNKKRPDFTSLTTTLILIIFFFLITEIPYLLVSRISVVTFFFHDSPSMQCNTKTLEVLREFVTLINAFSLTADFILYYIFCPAFYKVLIEILKTPFKRRVERKSIRKILKIFIINRGNSQKSTNSTGNNDNETETAIEGDECCATDKSANNLETRITVFKDI